jgi:hypothetical protein
MSNTEKESELPPSPPNNDGRVPVCSLEYKDCGTFGSVWRGSQTRRRPAQFVVGQFTARLPLFGPPRIRQLRTRSTEPVRPPFFAVASEDDSRASWIR